MGLTVDLDIGGTFTDCFVADPERYARGKADTTHYNVAVGFKAALEEAADNYGISFAELLEQADVIRYATTISMNTLIERTGPKLGLIVTRGMEDVVAVGRGRSWGDGLDIDSIRNLARVNRPEPLIPRSMVVGVAERLDYNGEVLLPLQREDVLEKLQYLVDNGARGFVVALLWSHRNPAHERMIREIIEEEYPGVYLGNMPVLLSSDISPTKGEYLRTMTTILNAYMHNALEDQLHSIGEDLREHGYNKPLITVHNVGGSASAARTSAIHTYGSGPVSGLHGGASICRLYGIDKAVVTDMGGTSFDFGVLVGGKPKFYYAIPVIERFRVSLPMMEMRTIGAGGGSIAWVNPVLNRLQVGPRSASSSPGPACYDQGGLEPTVTDADVVLGYIDPDYFHGGQKLLNREKAAAAIREKVAEPLGMTVVEAAWAIKRIVDAQMGQELFKEVALKGYEPKDFVAFAYGGAGPTHCCGYAETLGAEAIYTFPFSAVFSAYGSSTVDMGHVYEAGKYVRLFDHASQRYLPNLDEFNDTVRSLQEMAYRDLEGEGFRREEVQFELELEMKWGSQLFPATAVSPRIILESEDDVKAICQAFEQAYGETYGAASAYPEGGVEVELFRLKAACPVPHFQFPLFAPAGEDPGHALKGKRRAYWGETVGHVDTPVYQQEELRSGNVVIGPALIETADTTCVIPPGWWYAVNRYLNGEIRKLGEGK